MLRLGFETEGLDDPHGCALGLPSALRNRPAPDEATLRAMPLYCLAPFSDVPWFAHLGAACAHMCAPNKGQERAKLTPATGLACAHSHEPAMALTHFFR